MRCDRCYVLHPFTSLFAYTTTLSIPSDIIGTTTTTASAANTPELLVTCATCENQPHSHSNQSEAGLMRKRLYSEAFGEDEPKHSSSLYAKNGSKHRQILQKMQMMETIMDCMSAQDSGTVPTKDSIEIMKWRYNLRHKEVAHRLLQRMLIGTVLWLTHKDFVAMMKIWSSSSVAIEVSPIFTIEFEWPRMLKDMRATKCINSTTTTIMYPEEDGDYIVACVNRLLHDQQMIMRSEKIYDAMTTRRIARDECVGTCDIVFACIPSCCYNTPHLSEVGCRMYGRFANWTS